MRRPDLRFALVLACFTLSGFSGLLYETVWTREFSFVFGTSGLAVSTVLAAYMGGLAAGASLAARFVDRIERPVWVYGLLELGIASTALGVPWAIEATRHVHVALLRGVTDPGSPLALALYLVTSFVILGVPTTFMGATLPLLAREVVHSEQEIGPRIGALYAINTFGAVAGTLAAAFWLIPALGLRATVYVGAGVNVSIFLLAWWLSASAGFPGGRAASEPGVEATALAGSSTNARGGPLPDAPVLGPRARVILILASLAGVAAFSLEVLWVRLIEHVLGGSVYAFAAMLASFLIGIAGGGALAARFARSRRAALSGLAWSQLGAALCSLLAYQGVLRLPEWLRAAEVGGGFAGLAEAALLAGAILLPSTLCLGAMLPFAVRALSESATEAASASARVYAWNTLGAIVGSIAVGFVLLPRLGFEGALLFAVGLNAALAGLAWILQPARGRWLPVALAGGLIGVLVWPPGIPWPLVRSAPGRLGRSVDRDDRDVLFYAVGRSATVLATRERGGIRIRTNGMPEAIISAPGARPGHGLTTRWLGVLAALQDGSTERMLVIGLGGSVLLESVPREIERIDVVELEPEVVAANRAVDGERKVDVAADERVRIRLGDARGLLELEATPYDAIVSQPSHPWTAGSSHLYTRDFFERVRGGLTDDGLFVQWIDAGFVDEPLLRGFAATLTSVFPHVRLYSPRLDGLVFVASMAPLDLEGALEERLARDGERYRQVGLDSRAALVASLLLDEAGVRAVGRAARPVTDDFNRMATLAPFPEPAPDSGTALARLFRDHDPLVGATLDLPTHALVEALIEADRIERAERLVDGLPSGAARTLSAGILALARGDRGEAERRWGAVPSGSPEWRVARWYRLRIDPVRARHLAIAGELIGSPPERFSPGSPEARVIEGWVARGGDDPGREALEALDAALAAIDRRSIAYADARALRIAWRLDRNDPERAREALALIDERIQRWPQAELVSRAYAAAWAGDRAAARDSLVELASLTGPLRPALARRLRAAIVRLGTSDLPANVVSALDRRIRGALDARGAP